MRGIFIPCGTHCVKICYIRGMPFDNETSTGQQTQPSAQPSPASPEYTPAPASAASGDQTQPATPAENVTATGTGQAVHNVDNARRRVRGAAMRRIGDRISELEQRLSEYEGKDDEFSKAKLARLNDRIEDLRTVSDDGDAAEFENEVYDELGPEMGRSLMRQTERYAEYVNRNEPELLKLSARRGGKVLLHEWCKRMDVPELREEWMGMTSYEKGEVLSKFFKQINSALSGNTVGGKARPEAPVPGSGRDGGSGAPANDFAAQLEAARRRRQL